MIKETFDMSFADKLRLIGQVFAKIAINFWPVIVLGIIGVVIIHRIESSTKH